MSTRYQLAIVSAGEELRSVRERLVKTVVFMGHLPIDLVATGILDCGNPDTVSRHLSRSDYLILALGVTARPDAQDLATAAEAVDLALEHRVPVLALLFGDDTTTAEPEKPSEETAAILAKIKERAAGLIQRIHGPTQTPQAISELVDAYPRPGWVSTEELPPAQVATELARLSIENMELRDRINAISESQVQRESRWEHVVQTLEENKLLIPVWNKIATIWEQPVEMDLFTFFIRMGPQLAVEISSADAVEFIPTGVCQLESRDGRPPWVVPLHSLNLWLTDLMALGLVRPSRRKRQAKDQNQYWRLTRDGRGFMSYVRRSALNAGGHRHVGFTQEFPIPEMDMGEGT